MRLQVCGCQKHAGSRNRTKSCSSAFRPSRSFQNRASFFNLNTRFTIHRDSIPCSFLVDEVCGSNPTIQARVAGWVQSKAKRTRRIAAVCTGAYAIAPTGLLDGRRVTTHWRFAVDFAARFPKVKVQAYSLYVKDGAFYSSAGITAGIDLSLALIEEDFGPHVALEVARDLVVYLKRSGGQEQYSAPLQFQSQAQDRLADVAAWIANNLTKDLSVERANAICADA